MPGKNKTQVGTIVTLSSSESSEIMSLAGFDWIMIDMEHSSLSFSDVQKHLQALRPGVMSVVRIPANDDNMVKRVLDAGADGIMVPMVNSAEEAWKAVRSAFYPPQGTRSVGISRAHGFGLSFNEYVVNRATDVVVLVQVEHIDSVNNIESILKVKGISGIFIGPYDLSASMNMMGEVHSDEVKAAINSVISACEEAGMPWGIFGMRPDAVYDYMRRGCSYLLCGIDSVMLSGQAASIVNDLNNLKK